MTSHRPCKHLAVASTGFTLIELPSGCLSNLRHLGIATVTYIGDHGTMMMIVAAVLVRASSDWFLAACQSEV